MEATDSRLHAEGATDSWLHAERATESQLEERRQEKPGRMPEG